MSDPTHIKHSYTLATQKVTTHSYSQHSNQTEKLILETVKNWCFDFFSFKLLSQVFSVSCYFEE